MSNKSVLDLATAFAEALHEEVGSSAIDHINQKNHELVEGACASHEFCDANVIMNDAFTSMFGREPEVTSSDVDIALWNAAWGIAKECEFSSNSIRRYFDR